MSKKQKNKEILVPFPAPEDIVNIETPKSLTTEQLLLLNIDSIYTFYRYPNDFLPNYTLNKYLRTKRDIKQEVLQLRKKYFIEKEGQPVGLKIIPDFSFLQIEDHILLALIIYNIGAKQLGVNTISSNLLSKFLNVDNSNYDPLKRALIAFEQDNFIKAKEFLQSQEVFLTESYFLNSQEISKERFEIEKQKSTGLDFW